MRRGNPVKIVFHHKDKFVEKLISRFIIPLIKTTKNWRTILIV